MKILVAVPCMDMVHTPFFKSCLMLKHDGDVEFTISYGSLIYDARNSIAKKAIEEGFDRMLWLDSDMTFEPDIMQRLNARIDDGCEFVSGLYVKRKGKIGPVIYKTCGMVPNEKGVMVPTAVAFDDYPKDQLFQIEGCGFGGVMMTVDLLKRVREKLGLPFYPSSGFGEDFSFCLRARQLGAKLWCDSSVKLGHVGYYEFSEKDIER